MHPIKFAVALSVGIMLAACGGGRNDSAPPSTSSRYSSLVSFGDSASDVGTYAVGTVKALGGGKFTVNAPDSKIWIELIAARLSQPAPCAAQTGLDGDAARGFSVPVSDFPACTAYAQGGARVTVPVGPGNKLLGGEDAVKGYLTVPVVAQINNHLARRGGRFAGDEIVFVMAGGNDLFSQLAAIASGKNPVDALVAMTDAGNELANLVESMVQKGARQVALVNLPDASESPLGRAAGSEIQEVIGGMTRAFNTALKQDLEGNANVLYVDAYALGQQQSANPAQYGLTNTRSPACDLSPEKNPIASSLICTRANVVPGNIDRFRFADTVHPTPYSHQLLADFVSAELTKKGWL